MLLCRRNIHHHKFRVIVLIIPCLCRSCNASLIEKRDFGYRKVAYKGLKKNLNRFHMLFVCANLLMLVRGGRTEQFCNAWPRGYCAQFRVRARKTGRKRGLKLGKKDLFWCNIRRILQKIRILGLADVLHAIVQRFPNWYKTCEMIVSLQPYVFYIKQKIKQLQEKENS